MKTYRLFALDTTGRVDRGFEQAFQNDDDAIRFASGLDDAALVEVMRGTKLVARVRHHNGRTTVIANEQAS
ncbi:hypothetical protein [Polymorphobacter fuscus]|uniref:Uncharacterized protein n=1 Tax=Sandarakinorhabdus fusca TaxID=1439888 RepID=A0A7C9KHJ1_9SPHN|nr:hypothetical protein [Polymorphobacter fuscus]KAB7647623.1 hypothetical protein F9290_06475 [Polymorphobacter fuscus]MQT16900.1 hypothetical protein [Polymorphobacter fuscus]NJC09111.1 hypothetical protein [Polymorphobacter fuscus]